MPAGNAASRQSYYRDGVSQGLITDRSLQTTLRPLVEELLQPVLSVDAQPRCLSVADWWDAPPGPTPGIAPADAVVCVDALRTTPHPAAAMATDGRFYFVEVVDDAAGPRFDVTGFLWRCGLSVIDVDRPVLTGPGGDWEFAIGIARTTPTRLPTRAETEAAH